MPCLIGHPPPCCGTGECQNPALIENDLSSACRGFIDGIRDFGDHKCFFGLDDNPALVFDSVEPYLTLNIPWLYVFPRGEPPPRAFVLTSMSTIFPP